MIVALAKQEGDDDPSTERVVGDLLNDTRNALKHYAGDDSLSFDLRADASEMIGRALSNYQLLTGMILEGAMHFWGDASDT